MSIIFQVKASSFVGLNEKGEVVEGTGEAEISASTIHRGVHHARPDAVCAFHLHPPYCTAIGIEVLLLSGVVECSCYTCQISRL